MSSDANEMLGSDPSKATGSKMELVQPAPAAMPSEEDGARTIYESNPRNKRWDLLADKVKDRYREQARAVLALFAPIAEKPPTLADDAASQEIAVQPQPRIGAKRASDDNRAAADMWQDRALAAEAALAAERERFVRVAEEVCVAPPADFAGMELEAFHQGADAMNEAIAAATRSQEQP